MQLDSRRPPSRVVEQVKETVGVTPAADSGTGNGGSSSSNGNGDNQG